ncbi:MULTISPECIES: HrcA family transcriptional regulator [unclassified Campylobacter]|uniref:HrcA family transcriptional regulator n=1 Tax=unclassified Campylobacter TaxID=2593542 RepID=UPI001237C4D4|nr:MULTISPECIES: HrcA family transcriptional regulator [unclassified Campylobacter]KAA6224902.1 HrcA family transcriptional regulator [Campylobacter sp. LR185c]KAA6226313.1 HrcA family transcriptional regulator [Campylobacter sp. LR286c]KAA6226805.1 HrcA family transcriptional regulator [Campylobacter sp. LR196d]KAA6230242.1 HrcA family transcriptional regulator [Campylobacter sp. LR291e]KAA6233763.1 HrcA family transcriptional regulator [Campylobacter sp. LR264d]
MKSRNKRDLILESIIQTYLLDNVPIGSNELNSTLCIPASTIRVYLKQLSDEGILSKIHLSSGRIPTILTMQNYWENNLDTMFELDIKNIDFLYDLSKKFEIYCLVYAGRDIIFKELFSLNNKFIILDFEESEIALKYQDEAFKFLKTLIGFDLFSLEALALRLKFFELVEKIDSLKQNLLMFRSNEERAYQIYKNDDFVRLLDSGINRYFTKNIEFEPLFKEGFMGLKIDTKFLGKNANIILAGSVYTDYKKILNQLKEVA